MADRIVYLLFRKPLLNSLNAPLDPEYAFKMLKPPHI